MSRSHKEDDLQIAVARFLDACLMPSAFWFAIPNGGKRNVREAARMKRMGTRAGVPDLCVIHGGRSHFIELKVGKNGLTDSQKDTIPHLTAAGCDTKVCRSIEDVQAAVLEWNLPLRGRIV